MSRLPQLERALHDAAQRLDAIAAPPSLARRRWAGWRHSRGLVIALVVLIGGGVAVAATTTGWLSTGSPVPTRPYPGLTLSTSHGFTLSHWRVADPDGGLPWTVATAQATTTIPPRSTPSPSMCVYVGRVQNDTLGVVGQDGVFHNDGEFHPLTPGSQASFACSTAAKAFALFSLGPPIPASGYTGAPGTAIGGCRERVNLNGPTVSPQTRKRLRDVPKCRKADLRDVIAGYAGPDAKAMTLTAGATRQAITLQPGDDGAYIFVIRPPAHGHHPTLTLTRQDGTTCHPLPTSPGDAPCPP